MSNAFHDILGLYDFTLPEELIANIPAHPRDSAKLLSYDRIKNVYKDAIFRDIATLVPMNTLFVLNDTKVIPARLPAVRETGGTVKLLILKTEGTEVRALSPKILKDGETLHIDALHTLTVRTRDDDAWLLTMNFPSDTWNAVLERCGETPLPPYIKNCPLTEQERRTEYQTVFADTPGSIAAPTASLHFTPELLSRLRSQGMETATVTLHVHLGTFAPLNEEQWNTGKLHEETYHIAPDQAEIIVKAIAEKRPIIAVGTTAVRTLETAFDEQKNLIRPSGVTDIFIRPASLGSAAAGEGYRFHVIDGMITNFHVPKSSLLMLVAAFMGREKLLELYAHAIEQKYRFYSFGDAMLIL